MNYKILCLLGLLVFGKTFAKDNKIVDMSYPYDKSTIYWPTEKGFDLKKLFYGMRPGNYFYSSFAFCTPEHGGTHIDAPRHFSKNGLTVDKILPQQLVGNVVVVDVRKKTSKDRDYAITVADIQDFEKKNRELNQEDIVFFNTGWAKHWSDKKAYLGTDKFGDVKNLHFPGLSKEAAEYLVSRKIKGIGLDTASMDPGISQDFWTHRVLLGADIFGVENLSQVDLLPTVGARVVIAPIKVGGGSGGPARVFAFLPY